MSTDNKRKIWDCNAKAEVYNAFTARNSDTFNSPVYSVRGTRHVLSLNLCTRLPSAVVRGQEKAKS